MQPLQTDMTIAAPRLVVWDALSDVRRVVEWNPGVDDVECLSQETSGPGARRRCFTHPTGWMSESVTEWVEGITVAFSVDDAPPLKHGVARFMLSDAPQGTDLSARFEYEVRLGPLGPVIDRLIVHRQLSAAWERGLEGLREYTQSQWDSLGTTQSWTNGPSTKERMK